jgi:hypothetical protein
MANMALPIRPRVAGHEHLREQAVDLGTELAHELGDVGVARARIARQGHEQHVVIAGRFDLAAGDETAAVGQQHDLEHDARVVGAGAGGVVAESGVQRREVEFVIDQVVQCEFERAGLDLLFEHHRDEHAVALGGLVAGHPGPHRRCGGRSTWRQSRGSSEVSRRLDHPVIAQSQRLS